MPSGVQQIPPEVCGFDTLTRDQLAALYGGSPLVPGLPFLGPYANEQDLPVEPTEPEADVSTRAVCRMCASVCDCRIVHRGCAAPVAANKAMPAYIASIDGLLSGGTSCGATPTMQPHQVFACRNGTCVFEDLANAGAALHDLDTSTGDGGNPDAFDGSGR